MANSSRFEIIDDNNANKEENNKEIEKKNEQNIEKDLEKLSINDERKNDEIDQTDIKEIDRDMITNAKKAAALKEEGNKFFLQANFHEAYNSYTEAIETCPLHKDYEYNRSVYFSNRAACLLHLNRTQDAIDDCTNSIELCPTYIKAFLRRAQAYEVLEKYEEALKDIEHVLEMDKTVLPAIENQKRLNKLIAERNEKLKEEMLGKLKGFGNTILGKFGLSTDNFQMVKDPQTGSYNINFKQNK